VKDIHNVVPTAAGSLAWFYKAAFEVELSWVAPARVDDDLSTPRATVLPKPTHPSTDDRRIDPEDLIPF